MTAPFSPDDMARWAALDLGDREVYDLMLLEVRATGFEAALADMDVEVLHHAIREFLAYHGHTPAARLACQAWLVSWHDQHPEASWMIHARSSN